MPPRRNQVSQEVTDISAASQLLRYAAAGQLEVLCSRRGLTHGAVAQGAGFGTTVTSAGPALTKALGDRLTPRQLNGLDEVIGALVPDLDGTGGLCSLALRLSAESRREMKGSSLTARVPPSWTAEILGGQPADELGVLIQASALLSEFIAADKIKTSAPLASIRDRYSREMKLLVPRLILISVTPPTSRTYDAQILLGMLASYAFSLLKDRLESQLRDSPMSFRVWRPISKLVMLSAGADHSDALRGWVQPLIGDSGELRNRSLHAGSGSDLELAVTIPAAWSPPGDDWVGRALLSRARNNEATIRERGTAAMGLWQRALTDERPDLIETEKGLRELIAEWKNPATRPDAAAGLNWLALTLEHAIENREPVCNDWPDPGEEWFQQVQDAAGELSNSDIPPHLVVGAKNLFRHMILQNAGVYRRQAVETVVTSGQSEPVARALGSLLRRLGTREPWLRIRVESALGFMQVRDVAVETDLTRACLQAYANLNLDDIPDDQMPPRSRVTEMHASLFAVGDCFGVTGAEDLARNARERLRPVLEQLASMEGTRAKLLRRAARAAAYLLTVTAQPRIGERKDLSEELLEKLSHYPDPVTAELSKWALSFRFAPDGNVRPFLAAARPADS
jgi:hypothetical protein